MGGRRVLNTSARYRFAVMLQLVYHMRGEHYDGSWLWCKTCAFSSNLLIADPGVALLGSVVVGIPTPIFGTQLAAQLESWDLASWGDWHFSGMGGAPRPRNIDLGPGTVDLLPALGGSGFDLKRLRCAIPGARLRPPTMGPRVFIVSSRPRLNPLNRRTEGRKRGH